MTEINQADFNVLKAKAISRGKLLDKVRSRIVEITDHIQNEGDRAYFGSTNHADELVKLFNELDGLRWDRIMAERPERDPYADCRELRASIVAKDAEIARLREALQSIRDIEPSAFNAYPSDWNEQIAACDKCQSYKNHPVMRGICDTHRQPTYDRERHDAHEVRALGYRAKGIARDALSPALSANQTEVQTNAL